MQSPFRYLIVILSKVIRSSMAGLPESCLAQSFGQRPYPSALFVVSLFAPETAPHSQSAGQSIGQTIRLRCLFKCACLRHRSNGNAANAVYWRTICLSCCCRSPSSRPSIARDHIVTSVPGPASPALTSDFVPHGQLAPWAFECH
jgi:hypothetical protein